MDDRLLFSLPLKKTYHLKQKTYLGRVIFFINTRCPCTVVMKNGILSRKYIICEEKNINIVQKNFI